MRVYQLWVRGPRVSWLGEGTFFSREVFLTEADALAHLPEMDRRARGAGDDPSDLTEVTAHGVIGLDLVGAADMTDAVLMLDRKLDAVVSAMPDRD